MTLAIPIPVADRSWSYRGVAGCTAGILFMEEWGQLPNRSTVDVVIAFGAVEERKEIHDEKKKVFRKSCHGVRSNRANESVQSSARQLRAQVRRIGVFRMSQKVWCPAVHPRFPWHADLSSHFFL